MIVCKRRCDAIGNGHHPMPVSRAGHAQPPILRRLSGSEAVCSAPLASDTSSAIGVIAGARFSRDVL